MGRPELKGIYAAPAVEKAFEVLEALALHAEGALISEIASQLGRSVGELFRTVVVLEQLGYLRKSSITDRYTVAYKLLDLAYRAPPTQDFLRVAMPEMQVLALEAGQSCHLVVPNGGKAMVIAREEQPGTRGFALKPGAQIDIINSCSGQVILAFSNPREAERIVRAAEDEQSIIVDRNWLDNRIAVIRRIGYDIRKSVIAYGVTYISVPLFGFDRSVVAALTIPYLELLEGSQKVDINAARDLLRIAAARVSERLGYQP